MDYLDGLSGLNKFGKFLIRNCKDSQLKWLETALEKTGKNQPQCLLMDKLQALDDHTRDLIRACVAVAAVNGLHDFLSALEKAHDLYDNEVRVVVDGQDIVDLAADGIIRWDLFDWDRMFSGYPNLDEAENCLVTRKPLAGQ